METQMLGNAKKQSKGNLNTDKKLDSLCYDLLETVITCSLSPPWKNSKP